MIRQINLDKNQYPRDRRDGQSDDIMARRWWRRLHVVDMLF